MPVELKEQICWFTSLTTLHTWCLLCSLPCKQLAWMCFGGWRVREGAFYWIWCMVEWDFRQAFEHNILSIFGLAYFLDHHTYHITPMLPLPCKPHLNRKRQNSHKLIVTTWQLFLNVPHPFLTVNVSGPHAIPNGDGERIRERIKLHPVEFLANHF